MSFYPPGEIKMPGNFIAKDFTQPEPVPSADGAWYFLVYGRFGNEPSMAQHVFKWRYGMPCAEHVPLAVYTNARGSFGIGGRLWLWAWHTDPADNKLKLIAQDIEGWVKP